MTDQRLKDEVDQLRVQLAGCGVAALGHTSEPANPGDYGWSPAYEDTLKLRLRFDALYEALSESLDRDELPLSVKLVLHAVRKDIRSGVGMSVIRAISINGSASRTEMLRDEVPLKT